MSLTYAIGDIHGCLDKLRSLMLRCEMHADGRSMSFVFVGDYIDRGPQSSAVIDCLIDLKARHGECVVTLMGNHEAMALAAFEGSGPVRLWLAQRPRFRVHYTPTYSSWLNQVEPWFGLITQQAIRRGSFRSVKHLIARIDHFVQHYNQNCRPFAWTATADSILQKLTRLCSRISGTQH